VATEVVVSQPDPGGSPTSSEIPTVTEVYGDEAVEAFHQAGHWGDQSIVALLDAWADEAPEDIAIVDEHYALDIREVQDRSRRLATVLAELGVRPRDRVLVQIPNQAEAIIAVHAVGRLGAITVFAQTALREAELAASLRRTEAAAVVTVTEHRGFAHAAVALELTKELPSVRGVVAIGAPVDGATSYEDAMEAQPCDGTGAGPDEPFCIIFTSGTTSLPKGCVHTSNTLVFSARGTSRAMDVGPSDVMFMSSPLMHSTGLVIGTLSPLINRIPTVLQTQWEPERALRIISEHRCTTTLGPTTFGTMMLDVYDPARHDISSFRTFALAGAPIPSSVVQAIHATFGCRVVAAYGSTEGLVVTTTRINDSIERIASSDGIATDGVEVDIVDDHRQPVSPGTEGEVRIKAPGRFLTYWRDEDRMREAVDSQNRLYSGDFGCMGEDGYLRITGRKTDIIIRGGTNISTEEVESSLVGHPDVADVAVVAMPDPRLGERACAYVVPAGSGGFDLPALRAFLGDARVAKFKWPERVEVVDTLPRNPTGKVEKWRLRDDIAAKVRAEVTPSDVG
jgi:acyl-coenzyme A synthetase/AMP-(fatty) acid ligase